MCPAFWSGMKSTIVYRDELGCSHRSQVYKAVKALEGNSHWDATGMPLYVVMKVEWRMGICRLLACLPSMRETLVQSPALYKWGLVLAYIRNPSTRKVEAEGSEVRSHPWLHSKFFQLYKKYLMHVIKLILMEFCFWQTDHLTSEVLAAYLGGPHALL